MIIDRPRPVPGNRWKLQFRLRALLIATAFVAAIIVIVKAWPLPTTIADDYPDNHPTASH